MTKTQKLFYDFKRTKEYEIAKDLILSRLKNYKPNKTVFRDLVELQSRDELNDKLTECIKEMLRLGVSYTEIKENSRIVSYSLDKVKEDIILEMLTENKQ